MRLALSFLFLFNVFSSTNGADLTATLQNWCGARLAPALVKAQVKKDVESSKLKVDFSKSSLTSLGINIGNAINKKFGVKGPIARCIDAVIEKYLHEDLKKKSSKENSTDFYPPLVFEGRPDPKREGSDYEDFEFNYASRALQKLPVTDEKVCKALLWYVFSNDRAEQIYLQMILLGEVASPATPRTNGGRLKKFLQEEFVDLEVEEWMATIRRRKKKKGF